MRRIYFLSPDLVTTRNIVNELHAEGLSDSHIHVLAKHDTPLGDLPEMSVFEKVDFIPALRRGEALGATTGVLAGLVALRFAGFAIAGGPVLGALVYGATIGVMISGLAGLKVDHSKVKAYTEAIERGNFLVMVDVSKERAESIRRLIAKHHPDAEFEGIESLMPPDYL
ncbi:MAG: DUF1269 domain-containing protein [Gammaproteobacteria bacterium]